MPGLIGTGQAYQAQASQILGQAQERESQLNSERQQAKAAETGQKTQLAGLGAGLGYLGVAGMAGGPVGMLAGAAAGYLLGELF